MANERDLDFKKNLTHGCLLSFIFKIIVNLSQIEWITAVFTENSLQFWNKDGHGHRKIWKLKKYYKFFLKMKHRVSAGNKIISQIGIAYFDYPKIGRNRGYLVPRNIDIISWYNFLAKLKFFLLFLVFYQ